MRGLSTIHFFVQSHDIIGLSSFIDAHPLLFGAFALFLIIGFAVAAVAGAVAGGGGAALVGWR